MRQKKLAAAVEAFRSLPNDRTRYQQLLALAARLPPMSLELKTQENKVQGCLSTVHVHVALRSDGLVELQGDSDALLTKGLVALLVLGLNNCSISEIVGLQPDFLQSSGIPLLLSPGRNSGFYNMFTMVKRKTAALAVIDEASH